ncbi:MAG: polymorphic toxin type 44 domain-containing protein, partial [Saprospiraceae bacterium]
INKAFMMNKDLIFAQLAENIPDQNSKPKAGAFDVHIFAPWSLLWESGGPSAPFDYSTKNFFLDRENFLLITQDNVNVVGHNFRNMGNFLWGAATYVMGVPQWMALAGAHCQNIFGEFGTGGLDNADDQYSIKLGRQFAKIHNWSTIYGGKQNVFKR